MTGETAAELLGLQHGRLLRAQGRLRRHRASSGMQVDEFKALVKELHKQRHRGHSRRGLQPHRRGQRARPVHLVPGHRQQDLLHAHARRLLLQLQRHAATRSTATIPSCATWCWTACATGRPNTTSTASASISPRSWAATQNGAPLANPPLLESLAFDPDPGEVQADRRSLGRRRAVSGRLVPGLWALGRVERQVPRRPPQLPQGRRRAWSGEMAQRLQGSPDLYAGPRADGVDQLHHCHDGFTLDDLVSYNDKHNEANGENNRDGANDNYSWNCGWEGPTDDPEINALRRRQMKNAVAMLMVSQGVPMILMGDEVGAHAARQQQHLLPRQRAELARLDAGGEKRRPVPLLQADHRLPPRPSRPAQPLAFQQPGLRGQRLCRHHVARRPGLERRLVRYEPGAGLYAGRQARQKRHGAGRLRSTWR